MAASFDNLRFPGHQAFYIFNLCFAILVIVQIGLYISQGVSSPCPGISTMFLGYMATQIASLLLVIFSIISICCGKFFNSSIIYGILVFIGKFAVIISVFIINQQRVDICYVLQSMEIGISIGNAAQALCILVEMFYLVYIRDIMQAKHIQDFLRSNRSMGLNFTTQSPTQRNF